MPVHKLVQKRKISRKFGVQTFALIKLNNRRRHHVCVLKSKAHDLLETSTAAWGYGISQEDNDVIFSRYSMGYFQYGGRYNPIIAFIHVRFNLFSWGRFFMCFRMLWGKISCFESNECEWAFSKKLNHSYTTFSNFGLPWKEQRAHLSLLKAYLSLIRSYGAYIFPNLDSPLMSSSIEMLFHPCFKL